jgi:predicted nucleic acid-binding Zn ribbon protein
MRAHVRSHCQLARELGLAQKSMEMKIKNQDISAKHKSEAEASSGSVPPSFECSECKEKFTTMRFRTHHMMSHGTEVKCEICSAGFRHALGLAYHKKRMHFQECKMLKCSLCDRVFERQPALNDHKKYVHGTRLKKKKQCRRKKTESDPLAIITAKLEDDDLVGEQSHGGGDEKKCIKSEVMLSEVDDSNDKPEEIILELKEEIHALEYFQSDKD